MMRYLAVIDGKVLAHHKKKKVVMKYLKLYKRSHPLSRATCFTTIDDDAVDPMDELVDVGKIYIQLRFEDAYYISDWYGDIACLKDEITTANQLLLKTNSKKKRMKLYRGILALEKLYKELRFYVPAVDELSEYKNRIGEWYYHVYGYYK